MKAAGIFLLFSFLIVLNRNLCSQTITQLESNYTKLQSALSFEQNKLDSLKNILNQRAKKIDAEKSKPDFNKNAAASLMAGSIYLSNEIDELQKKVAAMQFENESLKKELSLRYSGKIDSLQSLEANGNLSNEKLTDIKGEIFMYTEKKLIVSPKISLLSFYPEKIIGIDLSKIADESQKKIYAEYLQNALAEVNDRLKNVNENIAEVGQIVSLQKKTKRFLEETEFETNIPGQASTGSITQNNAPDNTPPNSYTGSIAVSEKAAFVPQVQEYSLLLSQLQQPLELQRSSDNPKIKTTGAGSKQRSLTYAQYFKLLKDIKSSLLEYKLILVHKIGNSK